LVLTEKDLISKPIIKRPKTFNPLGAILTGILMGIGHGLINNSLVKKTTHFALGILGFFLIILAVASILAVISLSAKTAIFNSRLEEHRKLEAQAIFQVMIFYLGYFPLYGFSLIFLTSGVEFWKMIVLSLSVVSIFSIIFVYDIKILNIKEIKLADLREMFFQPQRILFILLSFIPSVISTILLFFL
jgi:hypothetical protein